VLRFWLARKDSNLQSPVPETGALPLGHSPASRVILPDPGRPRADCGLVRTALRRRGASRTGRDPAPLERSFVGGDVCGIVVDGHRNGVKTKRHTTLPLIGFGEKVRRGRTRRSFSFVRTRQDAGLRRLQPGVLVHRERAAVLRRSTVQRAASLPVVPRSQEGRAWRQRWRRLLRRRSLRGRLFERPARDVQRNVLELRPRGPGSLPPQRREARLLQRVLHEPASLEQPLLTANPQETQKEPDRLGLLFDSAPTAKASH
jgi:hypothetical protein